MNYDDCGCKKNNENLMPMYENMAAYPNLECAKPTCNMPIRRHLQPVLVAKIYNQPIIEEIPYSSMSLTLTETSTISNAYSEMLPMCDDCVENYNTFY